MELFDISRLHQSRYLTTYIVIILWDAMQASAKIVLEFSTLLVLFASKQRRGMVEHMINYRHWRPQFLAAYRLSLHYHYYHSPFTPALPACFE